MKWLHYHLCGAAPLHGWPVTPGLGAWCPPLRSSSGSSRLLLSEPHGSANSLCAQTLGFKFTFFAFLQVGTKRYREKNWKKPAHNLAIDRHPLKSTWVEIWRLGRLQACCSHLLPPTNTLRLSDKCIPTLSGKYNLHIKTNTLNTYLQINLQWSLVGRLEALPVALHLVPPTPPCHNKPLLRKDSTHRIGEEK